MSWPEVSWYGQAIGAKRARRTPDESREDTHGARSFRPARGGSSPDGSVAAYFGKGLMVWAEGDPSRGRTQSKRPNRSTYCSGSVSASCQPNRARRQLERIHKDGTRILTDSTDLHGIAQP